MYIYTHIFVQKYLTHTLVTDEIFFTQNMLVTNVNCLVMGILIKRFGTLPRTVARTRLRHTAQHMAHGNTLQHTEILDILIIGYTHNR